MSVVFHRHGERYKKVGALSGLRLRHWNGRRLGFGSPTAWRTIVLGEWEAVQADCDYLCTGQYGCGEWSPERPKNTSNIGEA